MMPMRSARIAAAVALVLASATAFAAKDDNSFTPNPSASAPANPGFDEGVRAVDNGQWQVAIAAFQRSLAVQPNDASAYNYIGYANRKLGNYDAAFASYNQALAIDPEHKGAHEYIGEAYLETGNLAKAEEHLKKLDKICFFGCKEYSELKARVAEFKARRSS